MGVCGLLTWQAYVAAFALGILALSWPGPCLAALALALLLLALHRGWRWAVLAAVLAAFALGWGYASWRLPAQPKAPAWTLDRTRDGFTGRVDEVITRPGETCRVVLGKVRLLEAGGGNEELPGRLVLTWSEPTILPLPGQALKVRAAIAPTHDFANPGASSYVWYWRTRGVFFRAWAKGGSVAVVGQGGFFARMRGRVAAHAGDPDREGPVRGMLAALLAGERFNLDPDTVDLMRRAGLSHLLALSGLHLGFMAALGAGLALAVAWFKPRICLVVPRPKLAVLLAAPVVLFYVWLGGCSPSLVRAACMFASWGVLLLMGRNRVLMDGLFMAVAAILLVSPLSAFDLRLQMSVLAVAGIALAWPMLMLLVPREGAWWTRPARWAGGLLALSLAANLALLPLSSWYFGVARPNLLFNLVWVPALGLAVMPLGFAGMVVGMLPGGTWIGGGLSHLAGLCLDGLIGLTRAADQAGLLVQAQVLRPRWQEMLGFWLVLAVLPFFLRDRARKGAVLLALGLGLMLWPQASVLLDDMRSAVVLDVLDMGQGQSLVVRVPGGGRCLIDGGGLFGNFDTGEAVVAPALTWGRPPELECVILTHPHMDHAKGLTYLMERFRVGRFRFNGRWPKTHYGRKLREAVEASGIPVRTLAAGDVVDLGRGVDLAVLHPPKGFQVRGENEGSLVLRLDWLGLPLALLPGDVEGAGLDRLLATHGQGLKAPVLLAAHHGDHADNVAELYRRVGPDLVLCSAGFMNRFGFPRPETRALAARLGAPLASTSHSGMLRVQWNAPTTPPRLSR